MLTLPLEPTDDLANPLFKNAKSCAQWLKQLQLTNLQAAHSLLLTQVSELNRYPMRGLERLNTLEQLRETIGHVQNDYAKKLVAKPLPLNESELRVFIAIVQLWQTMVTGYQRCLQAYIAGDSQLAQHGALLCQRALLYGGQSIFEHLRTGYEVDNKLWQQLHSLYAFAEAQGLLFEKVPDPLDKSRTPASCHDVYLKILLTSYARPAELTRAQLHLLDRWLTQWSGTLTVERSYTSSKGDAQPLALDLASTHGLLPVKLVKHSDSMRYLAMVPLSKLLRVKTILLQQGKTPQQLELGDQNSSDCIEFLIFCISAGVKTAAYVLMSGIRYRDTCSSAANRKIFLLNLPAINGRRSGFRLKPGWLKTRASWEHNSHAKARPAEGSATTSWLPCTSAKPGLSCWEQRRGQT